MSSLIQTLSIDYPSLQFIEAEHFSWAPSEATVYYAPATENASALLLHELSHALLDHHEYQRDVQLLSMETAAWEQAKTLALTYDVPTTEDTIQDHLDTYRDWMHARSTCPECTATGYQSGTSEYTCPACSNTWHVNEARVCGLKRYNKKTLR